MKSLKRRLRPEVFQGVHKKKNYFEGYYYKIVDEHEKNSFALIPGIAYDKDGQGHSFIQSINSLKYQTEYVKFPVESFLAKEDRVDLRIGSNHFTRDGVKINLKDAKYPVYGNLTFKNTEPFPKTLLRPNIMGPFSYVPFMECYHGVVNIHHEIEGKLNINGEDVDFTHGYGYIEKDWGRSFPKWWVWMQSNHFEEDNVSLMFSVAKIPWLGKHFTGFLSFLKVKDKLYLFATYTGAQIKKLHYQDGSIEILVVDRHHMLKISGKYEENGILKASKNGLMERLISESISSSVKVVLMDRQGKVLFKGKGKNAGLEVVGKHLESHDES